MDHGSDGGDPVAPSEQERSAHSALVGFGDLDGKIALALGPKRAAAFFRYRKDWKRGVATRPFPLQIDFELNESCNLACPMCTWSEPLDKQSTRRLFSIEHFSEIVRDGVPRGLCAVGLNGINEPLMRRDLPDFVRVAREAGVLDIMLHTNGMLLTEDMATRLIEAGLTRLFVSLDAVTQATYDKIRVGGNLKLVERNIDQFLALRSYRAQVLPVLGVCFVRMSLNAHEEGAFIERWRDRADFFALQSYMNPFVGYRPDKDALASADRAPAKPFVCPQPFQRLRVSVGGEVHPCCSFYGDKITVGHIEQGISAVWGHGIRRGTDMALLRKMHLEGKAPEVCQSCMRHSFTEQVKT